MIERAGEASKEDDVGAREGIPSYVAHSAEDGRLEPLEAHLREVSEMAARFAEPLGMAELAADIGLMHDLGKYSDAFQDRILRDGPKVDHSTAGAWELSSRGSWEGAYCVMGHHAGLPDGGAVNEGGTLGDRLHRAASGRLEDYSAYRSELSVPEEVPHVSPTFPEAWGEKEQVFSCYFAARMLFSCLVDADYLCTERFMDGKARETPGPDSLPVLRDRFERGLERFYPPSEGINEVRCSVLDACLEASSLPAGVFSLTVPTGGGKTLAVTRFALNHAVRPGAQMRRVIYAVPYTSIIEQNAAVLREWLGPENVLEHHANFDFDSLGDDARAERLRLASENWDIPVVVTTNVQLFESLYAARTSRCRKLHNVAGSVIVLDEAQMLPLGQLRPCVHALAELVVNYGCTVVLCTATQPALNGFFSDLGLGVTEIAPSPRALFSSLERVAYDYLGQKTDEDLEGLILAHDRILCVVDSRRQARALYDDLDREGVEGLFHLSTLMYPEHRRRVLAEIRERLSRDGARCRVVSTSLVEAGVDVDFPVVMRSISGVDSVIQAAGRCNREGRLERGVVRVFSPDGAWSLPGEVRRRSAVTRDVIREALGGDFSRIGSLEAIEKYFTRLYAYSTSDGERDMLDEKDVLSTLSELSMVPRTEMPSIPFRTAAERFRMIDGASLTVIVPTGGNEEEVEALRGGHATMADMRRLGQYAVGVYEGDIRSLFSAGAIEEVAEGTYLLVDESLYSEKTGLSLSPEMGKGLFW